MGAILPSGLATDDTTKHFFGDLTESRSLWSFFEFENEGFFAGAGQGHMLRFALTTISGRSRRTRATDFVFQAKAISDLTDSELHFALSAEDIGLLNPNTRTCPIFRSHRDAELTKAIYRRVPVLIREARDGRPEENQWGIRFNRMFDMANDSHLFRTREHLEADGWQLDGNIFRKDGAEYLPLYEAKMIQQYNHRHGDFADGKEGKRAHILPEVPSYRLSLPDYVAMPFYWIEATSVQERLGKGASGPCLFGWRDVTDARASARTTISSAIPMAGAGDTWLLMFPSLDTALSAVLVGCLNSFASDYATRQKVAGLHLKYHYFKQLSVLPPGTYTQPHAWIDRVQVLKDWFLHRVLELTYTAWDLGPFAQDCGWSGPPFRWNEERRFLLRCELDAAFFHLYLPAEKSGDWRPADGETAADLARFKASFPTPRDAVAYIMDTFPIVCRRDEEKWGDYRTKRVILEIYDELAESIRTGHPYQTRLDPPPAGPRCCHPEREESQL